MDKTKKKVNYESYKQVLEFLQKSEMSPLRGFFSLDPKTDFEYLNMWFEYLSFNTRDNVKTWQLRMIDNYFENPEELKNNLLFQSELKSIFENVITKKTNKLGFVPRVEQYVATFPEIEQQEIRKFIIIYLYYIYVGETTYKSILDLCNNDFINTEFVFKLTKEHKIFEDKLIMFEEKGLGSYEKNLINKHIEFQSFHLTIFSDFEIPRDDPSIFLNNPLASFFNIIPEEFKNLENLESGVVRIDEIDEEGENKSVEEYINSLEQEETEQVIVLDTDIKQDDGELIPYKDDLDYLHQKALWFEIIAKIKKIKNENSKYDNDNEELKELEQKRKKLYSICEGRLLKSKETGFIPKIEKIAKQMKLSSFEKEMLIALSAEKIFIDENDKLFYTDPSISKIIFLFLDDQIEQVKAKKYFLKSSKLVRSGFISINNNGDIHKNLLQCDIELDNRIVEYLIGERLDISDYIDGSYLYKPKISLDNVVLTKEVKERVVSTIENFPTFLKAKKGLEFSDVIEYGNSLVMLFVGHSGTGKTMLANAVANHLNKKILLFNFNSLSSYRATTESSSIFRMLFREARMNDAVLFFDESEIVLSERINELLIEIERHEGIVIFATNVSLEMDEALRRRINFILDFQEPGSLMRKKLWKMHLPKNMKLNGDVCLNELASRFELTGGLIKNAVFSALAQAVSVDSSSKPNVLMKHLELGAREQLNNKLLLSKMEEHIVPTKGIDQVILETSTLEQVKEIINFEKAKKVLDNEWGFSEVFPDNNGMAALFFGESGTGKTYTAEAIAFETGKKLKMINYSQVVSKYVGETEKNLESLFKDISAEDTILFFDEADALFAGRTEIKNSTDRYANSDTDILLKLIERKNIFAILTTNYFENIDSAFFRRMNFVVEFKKPGKELRENIWKILLPEKMPLAPDVNIKELSAKFEFNGGDIKNAIYKAAIRGANSFDKDNKISMQEFLDSCKDIQSRKNFDKKKCIGF